MLCLPHALPHAASVRADFARCPRTPRELGEPLRAATAPAPPASCADAGTNMPDAAVHAGEADRDESCNERSSEPRLHHGRCVRARGGFRRPRCARSAASTSVTLCHTHRRAHDSVLAIDFPSNYTISAISQCIRAASTATPPVPALLSGCRTVRGRQCEQRESGCRANMTAANIRCGLARRGAE